MSKVASIAEMGQAFSNLGSAVSADVLVIAAPMGVAALGGGVGYMMSDLISETIVTAANLTGRTGVVAEVATKGFVGVGIMSLGWRMKALGPLAKYGFLAAGIGSFASGMVDVIKYFFPVEEWGRTLGNRIRDWLKLGEGAVEGANRMSRAEYKQLLADQRNQGGGQGAQSVVIKL